MLSRRWNVVAGLLALAAAAWPSRAENPAPPLYDLSKDKVLYCVGYAHLDTQWRWDFCTTIDRYLRDTLEHNFDRFEKYPGYVFNFTGSVRYEMMKEYYPEHYPRVKDYVAQGRWHVSGSSVDEGDVNVPSAESIIRQVLYGNQFFRREFGKESVDFMLPDCFGFPASMPSIWAHCGLKGFSTQKLTWRSAVGIPFKVGVWEGLDGRGIIAAFDPGPYVGGIKGRVDLNEDWAARVEANGQKYGVFADYHYYGVGDMGGAPREEDIANYLASIDNPDSKFKVALTSSDQMFRDITPEQAARLPRYKGDLLLIEHSAGTLTSQAYMKRWNRKNEQLADAAERAAVAAHWLGGATYPREKLYRSWVRALANQMHDILPGTSIPRAYRYSWNDEILALNGFAAVTADSVAAVARGLDTKVEGAALVVYNPLAIERDDIVEIDVFFSSKPPDRLAVYEASGGLVASQIVPRTERSVRVLFPARVAPLSWSVYSVQPRRAEPDASTTLHVTERTLENEHYRITLNDDGDVASIVDKNQGEREMLAAPAKLVFTYEKPEQWPAWNMDWADRQKPPIDFVRGPAQITIAERGPVRAALRVLRESRGSIFVQEIRLAAGDAGRRIEFKTEIDWQSAECALKASFPLTVSNPKATYNWEMGTIERGNNEPTKFEVPSHQWFDLTGPSGDYGVSVLEDCKYGSDKPSDNELRLTLLYTPGVRTGYLDQHSQDWGRHDMTYALYGHSGDWREGRSEWQARRLNQPLQAFYVGRHAGELGNRYSMLTVSTPQVDVRAVKQAEDSDDHIIVRAQELWGRAIDDVTLKFGAEVVEAHEVDGQERRIGTATLRGGRLAFSMTPYSPRSFAVRLAAPPQRLEPPRATPIELPFNADVISYDSNRADGALDAEGRTIPAEMLPPTIVSEGIEFRLGPSADGQPNAVACQGQTLTLPPGEFDRLYLLATATEDTTGTIKIGQSAVRGMVQSWTGFIGQWDDREWDRECEEVDFRCEGKVTGLKTGYIKRDNVAWFATHRHHPKNGNEAYQFSYLFKYALPIPKGATTVVLPDNPKIVILAAAVAKNPNDDASPAMPLYDDFIGRRSLRFRYEYPPPPKPVFEGVEPTGTAAVDRQDTIEALSMGPPSSGDYVDKASGGKIAFRTFDADAKRRPHPRSGVVEGTLPRLHDGEAAQNHDDTQRCVWYDNEGRFFVDLGRSLPIKSINTYSWHRTNRAPQYFSVWGSAAEAMPEVDFKHGAHEGWTLIAVVDSRERGQGGVHGSSVTPAEGAPGTFRHLLWISEDVGEGTFFTEIDVHARD
jgi:alpha-mannosidase